jgi:hypothetical protein
VKAWQEVIHDRSVPSALWQIVFEQLGQRAHSWFMRIHALRVLGPFSILHPLFAPGNFQVTFAKTIECLLHLAHLLQHVR